ncbi:Protein NEDD1 [Dissostichus eleginoides]|uniref:Protein NEDD1 n=1 Tax=Dissostichus eleginoides TaxID=100907 RepID=A0AAD9F401_DISEL|nr:Protein NEDD1 [Dissostichus eleginoides]
MEEVTRLVSTGDCVRIWDAGSMAPLEQFNPHSSGHPVNQACWSSNNQYLVSASSSGDKLVVCSLKSSPVPVVELGDGKKQTCVSLSSSSQFLASGGLDHCVHIWDLKSKRLHRSLRDHKEEVTCVSFNSNDSLVASGSSSGDLVLHSLTTNLSSKAFGHGSNQPIHALRLSPLRRSLLGSVSDSGSVVLWDSNTQKELHAFDGAHKAPGSGLAFSPTSELLVVSVGLDKKIVCYDTASKIVLRSIRVDSPLTAVDFSPDGTGLVVGSTQGKILHYDLRNSSAPTRVTAAHKTSVTCLRFQSSSSKLKPSSRLGSTKIHSPQHSPRPSTGPAPHRQVTGTGGAAAEVLTREEPLPVGEKFSRVGRNSLDVFSPAREDPRFPGTSGDTPFIPSLEAQQVVGRASLDIFSPVREDAQSLVHRKTPLGTPLTAGRCYSPHSAFQTPPPIKEEEPITAAAESCDPGRLEKGSSSSLEGEGSTPPTSPQLTNHSQPAPPFFTPELRRANGIQAQLNYESPAQGAPPTAADSLSEDRKQGETLHMASSRQSQVVIATAGDVTEEEEEMFFKIHFIQNMIHETLEDFRDIVNLQVEMVRQFYIQLNEIHGLVEKYSVNESLVEEVEKLREENRRLKTNY